MDHPKHEYFTLALNFNQRTQFICEQNSISFAVVHQQCNTHKHTQHGQNDVETKWER